MKSSSFYDHSYFKWQSKIGQFGAHANAFKFKNVCDPNFTILDFGCGGGYLLRNLAGARKIGIEPNPAAHPIIIENGIEVYESAAQCLKQVGRETVDLVISNHALEHALQPFEELCYLRDLLKGNGKIQLVVPCDNPGKKWRHGDKNNHLFSWSPLNLGNLFVEAGFEVKYCFVLKHKWPPYPQIIKRIFGWWLFHGFSKIYARLDKSSSQVMISATKVS